MKYRPSILIISGGFPSDKHPGRHIYVKYQIVGMIAIEAIACGVPVVASSIEGLVDIVKDGENGVLCKSENVESLASGIIKGLNTEWDSNELRKSVEDKFNREITSRRMRQIYLQLLND